MGTRSIKLKLKTNSGDDSEKLRQGLWATHEMLNEGVAYYLRWLTLLRQDAIKERDTEQTKEMIKAELVDRIKKQQKRNGWNGGNNDYNEILFLLRQLYELIVPSSAGKTGDAQSLARTFLSPLVDPNSEGGKGTSKAGRKSRWKRLKEEGDPRWEEEYAKNQANKAANPTSEILQKLEEFGLKPLFPLFSDTKVNVNWLPRSKRQFVRNWDRDMFQQGIEKLLSWETWNRRVSDERQKLQEKLSDYYEKNLAQEVEVVKQLQKYEQERAQQLEHDTGNNSDSYRINISSVRGWENIYSKWLKKSINATEAELKEVLKFVQKDMPRGFGDPYLYNYLAKYENRQIWYGSKEKAGLLKRYAIYNALKDKLERSKEQATFTLPDPVKHPLWLRLDARKGYSIEQDGSDLKVIINRMLWPSDYGWEETKEISIKLAKSNQVERKIKDGNSGKISKIKHIELLDNEKGKQQIIYRDYSSGIPFEGFLGGAKLQFDRRYLEKSKDKTTEGQIGTVYLNISIDVTPLQELKNGRLQTPLGKALTVVKNDWPKVVDFKPEQLMECMKQTNITSVKGVSSLTEGMRVMSIDLGQRTSAAASIFEVTKNQPAEDEVKIFFKIPDTELYAIHRRSLLLNMPGESPDSNVVKKREQRYELYRAIRFQVRMLTQILRLHTKETEEGRLSEIQSILKGITDYKLWDNELKETWKQEISKLRKEVSSSKDEWKQKIVEVHRRLESQVGEAVSEWRNSLSKERYKLAKLSMWNVEELENTRKLLISWSKRSRNPGEMNRLDNQEKFGLHQLTHLQNLKEDRLKQMANLIVMTALGYKYDKFEKRWKESYPACQIILFEDLSRYRFKLDRPRRENSQLMKWAHRSIPPTVWMQGEIFGLQVGDVYAAFSSRFHAKTGAPGIRCRSLKEKDLADKFIKEALIRDKFITEEQWSRLEVGDIVPWKSGDLFVTLDSNRKKRDASQKVKLIHIHADINAAQNLQRRFWMHKNELFRISCQRAKHNREDICVPTSQSERWKRLMGKGYFVRESGFGKLEAYKWGKMEKIKINTTPSKEISDLEEMEEINQAIEEDLEINGEYVTLFRDSSGFFFSSDLWIPQVQFWSIVKNKIVEVLREDILKK